jgi:hypothetical protein
LKRGKTIIQLIRLCENMELDHQKAVDGCAKKKSFLDYSEDDLKKPPSPSDNVRPMSRVEEEKRHKLSKNSETKIFNNTIDEVYGVFYDCSPRSLLLRQTIVHLYEKLDQFWMRFNRTRIDCVCLQEEKTSLHKTNKDLKLKLKQYLVTVNMTNGQPAQKNERFANRPSSMKINRVEHIAITAKNQLIKKSKQERRPVTCIEGNLSNAVRHMTIANVTQGVSCYAIENKL